MIWTRHDLNKNSQFFPQRVCLDFSITDQVDFIPKVKTQVQGFNVSCQVDLTRSEYSWKTKVWKFIVEIFHNFQELKTTEISISVK